MKALLQRVSSAKVEIDGKIKGQIGTGLLVFVAFKENDSEPELEWMARKIIQIRIFNPDFTLESKIRRRQHTILCAGLTQPQISVVQSGSFIKVRLVRVFRSRISFYSLGLPKANFSLEKNLGSTIRKEN